MEERVFADVNILYLAVHNFIGGDRNVFYKDVPNKEDYEIRKNGGTIDSWTGLIDSDSPAVQRELRNIAWKERKGTRFSSIETAYAIAMTDMITAELIGKVGEMISITTNGEITFDKAMLMFADAEGPIIGDDGLTHMRHFSQLRKLKYVPNAVEGIAVRLMNVIAPTNLLDINVCFSIAFYVLSFEDIEKRVELLKKFDNGNYGAGDEFLLGIKFIAENKKAITDIPEEDVPALVFDRFGVVVDV